MFTLLLKKEIRDILNSPKFSALFGMGSLLILLAFYMGARNYQVLQNQYESAVRENLRQLEGVTDWSRVEPQIHLPPSPLASLISGVSNDIGRSVQVQAGAAELVPDHTRYGEDPVYAAFRLLDLEFVFQLILSLVAILLAYNAVNGEREQGTLKLM
ncbi:MAG TPA: ABC transporter permease subunit, partial [bacterium]|nr:ABC transporter permease subunit [bacterium]